PSRSRRMGVAPGQLVDASSPVAAVLYRFGGHTGRANAADRDLPIRSRNAIRAAGFSEIAAGASGLRRAEVESVAGADSVVEEGDGLAQGGARPAEGEGSRGQQAEGVGDAEDPRDVQEAFP